jgi:hypothetical protein
MKKLAVLPAVLYSWLTTGAAVILLAGCAAEPPEFEVRPLCAADSNVASMMQACKRTLRAMNFDIEKFDVEAGYIRTAPLSAGQFFELWRSDNAGAFSGAEANLHTVRRTVEATVTQRDGKTCLELTTVVQRLSIPDRNIEDDQVYAMYSLSRQSLQKMKDSARQGRDMTWTTLGRDSQLEAKILQRIHKDSIR